MSSTITIDTDVLSAGDQLAIMSFGADVLRAVTDAYTSGEVTYVVSNGEVIAAINPAEAGERHEHANEVMVQSRVREETVPLMVRNPRRRFLGWGPFESFFKEG